MKQLSGLDASFLYLETHATPMNIGGIYLFDPGARPFEFETYRAFLAKRLTLVRTFRERLVQVPLGLGRPYWISDPDFDLDLHLHHVALPRPGGWAELTRLMAREFARPLDRTRPLWEIMLVEGLGKIPGVPPGAFAMLSRVHHAAIDGVSGAEILGALLDLTPKPREVLDPGLWQPERVPGDLELIALTAGSAATHPVQIAKFVVQALRSAATVGGVMGIKGIEAPPAPFRAPTTPLNAPITPHRSFDGAQMSLDRIKTIKNSVEGTTVNDVVLAICSGALRRYLREHDALPAKPLVAMAPISVRGQEGQGEMGNQVSAMLVSLATHEPDPRQRLIKIHEGATRSKVYHHAVGARTLTDYAQAVPFSVAALAIRLYTGMQAAKLHQPIFNVIITNVPGPQEPLYMDGARLIASYGAAPLFHGVGVILVVFSYAGTLSIGVTACRELMPDTDVFARYLEESLDELEKAVRPRRRPRKTAAAPRRTRKTGAKRGRTAANA